MAQEKMSYEFEAVGHGDEDGFNDPVRTQFDTNVSRVVAREAIQNVLDAAVTKPAVIEFSVFSENPNVIPDVKSLSKIMEACKVHYPENKDSIEHFDGAIKVLKSKKINFLKISDYNTKGLEGGDDDRNGDYYCFLKSVGASSKSGDEGGSFGLGKGSFYAASALNSIFVSSVYEKKRHVFQGKLRLVSHRGDGGKIRRGNGSFGLAQEKPVRDPDLIPEFYKRKKQGTDIFIPGYKGGDDWEVHMIKSVLANFWLALIQGELEARIGNLRITAKNVKEQIDKFFSDESENNDEVNPLPYLNAYLNGTKFEESLPTLGKVQLHLIQLKHYPKRVACFRKTGMLIQEKRFHCTLPYAGVFICSNDEGNLTLRKMESPNHDKWDKNSAHSKRNGEPLKEVVAADKEYKDFIRRKLRELAGSDDRKEISIGGLERYLHLPYSDEYDSDWDGSESGEKDKTDRETSSEVGVDFEQTVVVSPEDKNMTLGKVKSDTDDSIPDDEGDFLRPGGDEEGGGSGSGGGDRPGEGGSQKVSPEGTGSPARKKLDIKSRSFATRLPSGKFEHLLILREGKPKSKCLVSLFVGTDDFFDKINVKEAKGIDGKKCDIGAPNEIKGVVLDKHGEAKIKLEFESSERYSLNTVVYEDN